MRRHLLILLCIISGGLVVKPVAADETDSTKEKPPIIFRLPKVGDWAEFSQVFRTSQNLDKEDKVTVRISVVGSKTVDDEECRWFELEGVNDEDENEKQRMKYTKLLIPVKYLQPGKSPVGKIVELWERKTEDEEWKEGKLVEANQLLVNQPALVGLYPFAELKQVKPLEERIINFQSGQLKCKGIEGISEGKFPINGPNQKNFDISVKVTYQFWIHEDAPFGVAEAKIRAEVKVNGKTAQEIEVDVLPIDFGTNANPAE